MHRAHALRRMGLGQCYAQGTRIEADGAGAVLCTGHTHSGGWGWGSAMDRARALRRMGLGQCYGQGTRIEADGDGAVLWTGHTH